MCIFCKIVSGEIKSHKIYEDSETLAVLDIGNDFMGHTLVMPKRHCQNMLDCPADVWTAVMKTVRKVSKHYVENCRYDGVNVFCNNGESAGQSVFHLHVHIIPQKKESHQHVFAKADEIKRDLKKEQALHQIN